METDRDNPKLVSCCYSERKKHLLTSVLFTMEDLFLSSIDKVV